MTKRLYNRVADRLIAEIEDGTYPPGSYFPSVADLATEHGVSLGTIRSAQANLRERGYLYTDYVDGHRRSVVRDRTKVDLIITDVVDGIRPTERKDRFGELAERLGMEGTKEFQMSVIPAASDIASRLDIDRNDLVVRRRIIQHLNHEPWALEDGYYPLDLAQELGLDSPMDIPEGTMRVLERAGHKDAASVEETYYWPAEDEESVIFDLPSGSPLLGTTRTVASKSRITRVMRYTRLAHRVRLISRLGDLTALSIIDAAHDRRGVK